MALYVRHDSPFWWMTLEGHGRKQESTGIRRDARSPEVRKKNKDAAEAIYHARMTQLARAKVGLPIESKETFQTFSTWYEEHHTEKHRGVEREKHILKVLRLHFGPMRLNEIRPARWSEYETARRKDGISINTIGRELAVMKTVLTTAVGEHIEVSPLAHVKRKTERLPAKRTITSAEEKKLLKELPDPELHDIYIVAVGTLLRQDNVVRLQRKHYHGSRLVVSTKTGPHQLSLDGPTVLQTRAAMVLRRRLPKTHDGFFFPRWAKLFSNQETHVRAYFDKVFRRACKRANIPWGLRAGGVVWHSATRASGATRLIREHGLDVRTVQLLGNWRSLDQMAEYLGLDLSAPAIQRQPSVNRKARK